MTFLEWLYEVQQTLGYPPASYYPWSDKYNTGTAPQVAAEQYLEDISYDQ